MDSALTLLSINLLQPMVLAFGLGFAAQLIRSDLRLPDPVHQGLTIYLLLAIGLKGGVALSAAAPSEVAGPMLGAVLLGAAIPLWCYPVLRRLGRFGTEDAGAIAANAPPPLRASRIATAIPGASITASSAGRYPSTGTEAAASQARLATKVTAETEP